MRRPNYLTGPRRSVLLAASLASLAAASPAMSYAQTRPRAEAARTARQSAPIDLTGYWTAVITEDWAQRMLNPTKGDFGGGPPGAVQTPGRVAMGLGPDPADEGNIPYEAAGSRAALKWDPATGDRCLAYGAPGILRQATRLRITWADDNALKLETDLGAGTRLLHFPATSRPGQMNYVGGRFVPPKTLTPSEVPAGFVPNPMGYSLASWATFGGTNYARGGYLKVETTHLTPGYYWTNGMPYTGGAQLTEHFRTMQLPDGSTWILLSLTVEDPEYLTQPFVVDYHFKKLPNGSSWNPQPCS